MEVDESYVLADALPDEVGAARRGESPELFTGTASGRVPCLLREFLISSFSRRTETKI